jgi:serine/threonine protein kinase
VTAIADKDLLTLAGTTVLSSRHPTSTFRLERVLGQGMQSVAFLALREHEHTSAPCVVKLLRPRAIRQLAGRAGAAVEKEIAALERLSERSPTPHVVRFLDAGVLRIGDNALELPWVAMEYIEGGEDGTSLRARVESAIQRTGRAFARERAHRAVSGMLAGVTAIHALGMVHRDIAPGNVLCTGSGDQELMKIADFGLARVADAATFGAVLLGTPGYCAPEQSFPDKVGVGPYTDVFGLACTIYYLLTGTHYLNAQSIPETLVLAYGDERPSLLAAPALCEELRAAPELSRELDRVLAQATNGHPLSRIQTVHELEAALLPLLRSAPGLTSPT